MALSGWMSIHHGGAVHADLGAHAPVGMPHRLFRRHRSGLLPGPTPKRTTGAGEQDPAQLAFVPAGKALENGGVLGIHRDDLRTAGCGLRHDDLPGADQSLLIGQGDSPLFTNGGQRGLEPDASGDAGDDTVSAGDHSGVAKGIFPVSHPDIRIGQTRFQLRCSGTVIDSHKPGSEQPRLFLQQYSVSARRKRKHWNTKTAGRLSGLPSDGAC